MLTVIVSIKILFLTNKVSLHTFQTNFMCL